MADGAGRRRSVDLVSIHAAVKNQVFSLSVKMQGYCIDLHHSKTTCADLQLRNAGKP